MHPNTRDALLRRGISTEVIEKVAENDHIVSNLKNMSFEQLKEFYQDDVAEKINEKVGRDPIPKETVDRVKKKSNEICAFCRDGISGKPYQIHHIDPYAYSQNNEFDNLMLICPTHHKAIEKKDVSKERQKKKRDEWYNLASIAREYKKKGIGFPYDAFEPVVYTGEYQIEELFDSFDLSPITAKHLSSHRTSEDVKVILNQNSCAIIEGASGIGKTTTAVGIGGQLNDSGRDVYQYRRSNKKDNRKSVREIIKFSEVVSDNCLLIVDDVNAWAKTTDIKKILKSANPSVNMLLTWTVPDKPEGDLPKKIFPELTKKLTWIDFKEDLRKVLKKYKNEFLSLCSDRNILINGHTIGTSITDSNIDDLFRAVDNTIKSTRQFVYMLKTDTKNIESLISELYTKDRADVPVLVLAVNQIAGFEKPLTTEEGKEISQKIMGDSHETITEDWVESIYEYLVEKELLNRFRDVSYLTIHREWARDLIASALGNDKTHDDVELLLQIDFEEPRSKTQRVALLWSWLSTTKEGNKWIRKWTYHVDDEYWSELLDGAISVNLSKLALVTRQLYLFRKDSEWGELMNNACEEIEKPIIDCLMTVTKDDINDFRQILNFLESYAPEIGKSFLNKWNPEDLAKIINKTDPIYYHDLSWSLASINKLEEGWCEKSSKYIEWEKILTSLQDVKKGNIMNIFELLQTLIAKVDYSIDRNMLSDIKEIIKDKLDGIHLKELRFSPMYMPSLLRYYPKPIIDCFDVLNPQNLAEQLIDVSPQNWRVLSYVSDIKPELGKELVRHINIDDLVRNLERYSPLPQYEFRVLVWLLTYGEMSKRKEISEKLFPFAKEICQDHNDDDKEVIEVIRAYSALNEEKGRELLKISGYNEDSLGKPKRVLPELQNPEPAKNFLNRLEADGENYDLKEAWEEAVKKAGGFVRDAED